MIRRRSWVDVLFDAVERLPGPPWAFYALLTLLFCATSIAMRLLDGSFLHAPISPVVTAFAALTPLPYAVAHYITRAAVGAMDDYQPALGDLAPERDALLRRLTTMPVWASIVGPIVGVAVWTTGQLTTTSGWGITSATSMPTNVVTIAFGLILNIGFAVVVFRAIAQTLTIAEIHRRSTGIRLWETPPHVAFSRLTFAMAVSLTVPYAVVELIAVFVGEGSVLEIVVFAIALTVAVLVFTLPLRGMHRRLVREKAQLLSQSNRSIETSAAALRKAVAAGEFEQAPAMTDALEGLAIAHERIRKLSTWPWSAETLRTLISSIGFPVLIWAITATLGRVLGFA